MDRRLQFKYLYLLHFGSDSTGCYELDNFMGINNANRTISIELFQSIPSVYYQRGDVTWKDFLESSRASEIFKVGEVNAIKDYLAGLNGGFNDVNPNKDQEVGSLETPEKQEVKPEEPNNDQETDSRETISVKREMQEIEDENIAEELFGASISMLVDEILEGYKKLFESGFQLKRPAGILGDGVLYSLSGNKLVESKLDPVARAGKSLIIEKMGVQVCEERSVSKIANLILTGKTSPNDTEAPRKGRLYFPLKMLEFAYGREQAVSENINGKTNFGNVSKYTKWEDYAKNEIKPSLTAIFKKVAELLCRGKGTNISFNEERKIKDKLNSLVDVFLCCVVVSEHNAKNPDILRIKVYDLKQSFSGNVASQIAKLAYGSDGGDKSISHQPLQEGGYYEFVHEVNHILYNAEPLFAYKAAEAYRSQGKVINWGNMLIGLQDGGKILPIGDSGINLRANLSHLYDGGSRSGKGLQTLLMVANGLLSGKPIFYIDNKPDMASLIKYLCEQSYVVNGANVTTNPEDGTDYFEKFLNPNRLIREDTPKYIKDQFGSSYNTLGNFYYVRALILAMSVIALRVEAPELLGKLGGDEGIMVVVDELANASDGLNNLMQFKGLSNIARTGFYSEYIEYLVAKKNYPILLEEWESQGSKGAKPKEPKEPKMKPNKGAYWFAAFYKSLADSILEIQRLDKAGLRNSEVRKSDVFVLSQILHSPSSDVSTLFARRNKESNNPSVSILQNEVLASLCMVGNTDGFIGYNAGKPSYLGQNNKSSKAYGKLDPYARNFAYVPSVIGDAKRKIENGDLGYSDQAVYYKPFLMFSDGKEDGYFVKNAFKYAKSAGIEIADLVARNEDPNRKGHLDPRVGFKEYLIDNGMTGESIKSTLSKSGEIANFVVKEILKYPGDWNDFIYDLRPEWIISIDQVVNAYKNGSLAPVKERLNELTAIYPEEFGLDPDDVLPRDVEEENFDNDLFVEDLQTPREDVKSAEVSVKDVVDNFDESSYKDNGSDYSREAYKELASSEDLVLNSPKVVLEKGEVGVLDLINYVTDIIIEAQGGAWGVETFEDIRGKLKINGSVIKITFSEGEIANLPHHYKRRVHNNLWGELFGYRRLTEFKNLRELTVINKYSLKELAVGCGASRRITDADGWFFSNFGSLKTIKTESGVFRRGEDLKGKKISYEQNSSSRVADFCSDLRKNIWGYTKEVSKSKDHRLFSKVILGALSGTAGLGVGAVEGGLRAAKGIKSWISAVIDVSKGRK